MGTSQSANVGCLTGELCLATQWNAALVTCQNGQTHPLLEVGEILKILVFIYKYNGMIDNTAFEGQGCGSIGRVLCLACMKLNSFPSTK